MLKFHKKNCENSTKKTKEEEEIWWLATTTAKTQSDSKVARFHTKINENFAYYFLKPKAKTSAL